MRIITQSMEGGHLLRWGSTLGLNGAPTIVTAASVPIVQLDGSRVYASGGFDATRAIPLVLNGSGTAVTASEIFTGFFFVDSDPDNAVVNIVGGSPPTAKHRLISFWSGDTGICTVKIDPLTQKLALFVGAFYWIDVFFNAVGNVPPYAFAAASTQGNLIVENTVYHLQVRVKLNGATSIVQVKLDDIMVINWTGTLPGVTMDRVMTHSNGASYADSNGNQYLATIIINDTVPDTCGNDTWTGIRRLKLQTVASQGTYSQFTPAPVQANYLNVREVPNDGDATTNFALSSGLMDSFPVSANALNVLQVTYMGWFEEVIARKTSGTFGTQLGVRTGGVDYMSGITIPLGVSYRVLDHYLCTNPGSLTAWTSAQLDATEIIYKSI